MAPGIEHNVVSRNLDAFAAATAACDVQGFAVMRLELASGDDLLALAHRAGRPSSRDGGKATWCVRPNGATGTYSMSMGPAELHTDSTYHDRPEPYVVLYVERPAAKGGESLVLRVDDMRSELNGLPAAEHTEALLREAIWRWQRPAALGGGHTSGHPVLDESGIRWRRDTLVTAGVDDAQCQAARRVASVAANSTAVRVLRLEQGDALLIDNRRVLHGRTGFIDSARRLQRIRFWELGK